jgi:hypothetical protein
MTAYDLSVALSKADRYSALPTAAPYADSYEGSLEDGKEESVTVPVPSNCSTIFSSPQPAPIDAEEGNPKLYLYFYMIFH